MRKIKKQGTFSNNRRRWAALALVLGLQLAASGVVHGAVAENALPTGETNQIGIESIHRNYSGINNALMTIKQDKEHGIALIDWQSFNIGSNATVNIVQHHLSDTLINKVIGNNLSEIYGKLNATGNVVLVNPNGMIFDGAVINVGGFAASTADINLNQSGGKITGWSFKQNDITQSNITLHDTVLNAGYSKVTANSSLHLPEDFAVDMSGLTNKVQLVANGDVQLDSAKIYAGDQIRFSGKQVVGIEEWEMDGNDYYANGDIIIRSDMNADDLGTVTVSGTDNELVAQNSITIYYNAGIVGKGLTYDGKIYNVKDYKNAALNISGISTSGTGSFDHVENGDVVGSEHSTPTRNVAVSTYTLVNNVAQLQDIDSEDTGNLDGRYALSRAINATGDTLHYASELNGSFYNQVNTAEGVRLVGADGSFSNIGGSLKKTLNDGSVFSFTVGKTSTAGAGAGFFNTTDTEGVVTSHPVTLSYALAREDAGSGYADTLSVSAIYDGVSYTNTYIYDGSTWVPQTGNNENLTFTEAQINASYAALTLAHAQLGELSGVGHADDFTLKNITDSSIWTSGEGFNPIGSTSTPFTGVFTGNGGVATYAINNLTINRPTQDDVGLFSVAGGSANITSTNLVNTVIIGRSNVGGIAGQLQGNASINWSSNSASRGANHEGLTTDTVGIVKSASNEAVVTAIGGIVGKMSGTSTLHGVSNNATVIGQSDDGNHTDGNISKVGGLVGSMAGNSATNQARITNSSNHGNVYGEKEVGGIAGDMVNAKIGSTTSSTDKTAATYNNAKIEGNDYVGGIVGKINGNVHLYNVYNTNEAQTLNTYIAKIDAGNIGGLKSADIAAKITEKEALHGVVKGKNYVGGIVGGMEAGSDNNEINVAYNAGNITGTEYVGGISGNLVGANSKIENAYNADNNTVVCETIVEDADFNFIKNMATSTLVDEELHPIWDGLATDTANMEKARYLMEYYSFYTVGSSGKTYYYFVSQKMEDDSSRMGARGLFVKKEPGSTSYHNVPLTELESIPLADRFYAIREGFRDANVTGDNYVGGIVGEAGAGLINKVYNAGTITGSGTSTGALIGDLGSTASLSNAFFVKGMDKSTGKEFSKAATAVASSSGTVTNTDPDGALLQELRSGEALKGVIGEAGAETFFKTVEKTDTAGNVYLKNSTITMSTALDAYTEANLSKFESLLVAGTGEMKTIYKDGTDYYLVTKTVAGGSATYTAQKLVWDGSSKYVSDGITSLTMDTISMIANQSDASDAKWIVYGDQTLPLLQAFMQNNDIQREFEYDGTTHNLVTDDVNHVYGRADFYEGAGKNVYTEGFEQLQGASSKYFVDNSSIWSPQHGYKLNSEAAIIVTPKDLQVSIEGSKVYGMHALEDYYVAALKYKKQYAEGGTSYTWVPVEDGSGNPIYIYYEVSGIGSSRTMTEVTDPSFWTKGGKTYAQNVDGLKSMAKDQSKFVVTVDGFVTEETMNALLGSLETEADKSFTWQAKDGSGYTVTDVQELGAGSYQLTDGVTDKLKMVPFTAKHANYAINYDATLKVEKAKLYYTLDGYREYGEANKTGYYIYELVGVDANSNSESVNGLLKSWDKANAGLIGSDLIISKGYGSKVNSNGISLNDADGAIGENKNVKWADRNSSSLDSYAITGSSGAKLADSESSWAKNYVFVFAPAGSINTSKTTGTGTQQATTITGVATSYFTVTPVDVTINVEGQRIYGDLMNATTNTGVFFTENGSLTNGVYNVTSSKTSSAPINWLYQAINSQHAGLVGTDVAYSASITAIYKNSDSFSNVVTGGILDAFNNQLKAVESSDPNKTAADLQINTYTNVGDYLIGGTGTGLITDKEKPMTVAGLEPTNYVFHDGTHSLKITKRPLNIDIKGSKVYGEATQTTGEDIGIGNITFDNIKEHDALTDEQLKALLIANQLKDADAAPYNTDTYLDVGIYTGTKTGITAAAGVEDLLHITNLSDALKDNYNISFTSTYTVTKRDLSIDITGEKTYGDVTQTTGSGYGFKINGLQNSETIGSLGNGLHEHGTDALQIKNKAKDVDGDEAGGLRDAYLDAGLYEGSMAADGTISNYPAYVNNLSSLADGGFKADNYAITQESSYKVNKKTAQVITSGSRVYGDSNVGIAYHYDSSGLLAGDLDHFNNATKTTTNSTPPTLDVGEYGTEHGNPAVLFTNLTNTNAEKLKKNYALTYADDFKVTKAALTIGISGGKQYGQATSTSGADYTFAIDGLKNADTIGGLVNGSSVGSSTISIANNLRDSQGDMDLSLDVDGYAASGEQSSNVMSIEDLLYINNLDAKILHNYDINTNSSYEVTPAPLFIDIQGQKVYGQSTSTNGADYSVTIGGLLNGELISGLGNGTQVGLGANVVHSGATSIVGEGRLLNVGTYYDTITLDGMELDGGQYRPRNYSITSTSTFTVAPNSNPDIDGARYNGGQHRKRRVLQDIRYLDIVDTGIRIE